MFETGNCTGARAVMLKTKPMKLWLIILVMTLVWALPSAAQEDKAPRPKKEPAVQAQKKPVLVNATRVSTDAAARSAAKEETEKPAAARKTKDSGESAVLEFKPAGPNAGSGEVVVLPKDSKKKKNIHGEVYGTTGAQAAGTQGGGGAVGATSKSGKTSVYVETERQRTTPPR